VSFVFDRQNEYAPWATKFFQIAQNKIVTNLSKRLGDLTFRAKAGVGGLQAADLLAHALYKMFTAPFTNVDLDAPELMAIKNALDNRVANRIAQYNRQGLMLRVNDQRRHRQVV